MTLYDKLEALTAPCRECDAEIAEAFGVPNAHFTATLDASVKLVKRELPDAEVTLEMYGATSAMVYNGGGPSKEIYHHHQLPAVALLLALVDAKGME